MANTQLPCDSDGKCMKCKTTPSPHVLLTCKTCHTPWHVDCLTTPPPSLSDVPQWDCPDCTDLFGGGERVECVVTNGGENDLVSKVRAIEGDSSLTEKQKAKKRQELMSGGGSEGGEKEGEVEKKDDNEILEILGENMKCSFCMQLPDRPVTTPCGHNFCLKCFEKWVGQGKRTCAKCRENIPAKMASQPRINSSLVYAIRMARAPRVTAVAAPRVIHYVHNDDLPDQAFTTDRAKKTGKANAKSGKIFVTIPNDFLGPITAEYDPVRKTGVLVGDCWEDRLACRQWGAHFPHVSGIAGQSGFGAQSVVLSGGYEDDEDHGEWFLYTGSGGRDLSGNKRTNKLQSSDQTFTSSNQALRHSCKKGYPVRVVRSHKEKRSNYAPDGGVRYDGIYRIEKCWRKKGLQGFIVCRYLFVRCDNSPAPWTSDEQGDRPRPLPVVPEMKGAVDVTERKETPHWDFDAIEGCWKWQKPPPLSCKLGRKEGAGVSRPKKDSKAKILKEFSCLLCKKVLNLPITTPCAHNFCKPCLDGAFEGQKFVRERNNGGRSLRTQKNVMKCPSCPMDISEFLQNAQVNRELMGAIESLLKKFDEDNSEGVEENDNENESDLEDAENNAVDADETETPVLEEADSSTEQPKLENGDVLEAENSGDIAKSEISSDVVEAENSDGCEKPQPPAAAKRGRKKKDEQPKLENGNVLETDNSGDIAEDEKSDECEKPNPPAAAKRGRKRKDAAAATGAAVRETRGRKARKVADDGNVSPSSPLHVRSDVELE